MQHNVSDEEFINGLNEFNYNNEFNDWFKHMLHSTSSCFERDVLRDCKEKLKERYIIRAKSWPNDPEGEE